MHLVHGHRAIYWNMGCLQELEKYDSPSPISHPLQYFLGWGETSQSPLPSMLGFCLVWLCQLWLLWIHMCNGSAVPGKHLHSSYPLSLAPTTVLPPLPSWSRALRGRDVLLMASCLWLSIPRSHCLCSLTSWVRGVSVLINIYYKEKLLWQDQDMH